MSRSPSLRLSVCLSLCHVRTRGEGSHLSPELSPETGGTLILAFSASEAPASGFFTVPEGLICPQISKGSGGTRQGGRTHGLSRGAAGLWRRQECHAVPQRQRGRKNAHVQVLDFHLQLRCYMAVAYKVDCSVSYGDTLPSAVPGTPSSRRTLDSFSSFLLLNR